MRCNAFWMYVKNWAALPHAMQCVLNARQKLGSVASCDAMPHYNYVAFNRTFLVYVYIHCNYVVIVTEEKNTWLEDNFEMTLRQVLGNSYLMPIVGSNLTTLIRIFFNLRVFHLWPLLNHFAFTCWGLMKQFIWRPLPCDWEVRGHCMSKEMPGIPVNRVADKRSIRGKNRGPGRRRGTRGCCPPAPPPQKKIKN
jgi:hypothetical protein